MNAAADNELLFEKHYYSFGMELGGVWQTKMSNLPNNDYSYNGKELVSEMDAVFMIYGKRMYRPNLGRFISTDPISLKFPFVSTYNYAENEPVAHIDLWGLQKYRFDRSNIVDKKGIIQDVTDEQAESSLQGALVRLSFQILDLSGLNTLDNEISDLVNGEGSITNTFLAANAIVVPAKPVGGVYRLRNENGTVVRTGRTNNLDVRKQQHANSSETGDLDFDEAFRTDNYKEQRGLEKIIYDENPQAKVENGGLNKIKPISDKNVNKVDYMEAAKDFLERFFK